jgi:secreted Zn-dependent insulinase-like peptidase
MKLRPSLFALLVALVAACATTSLPTLRTSPNDDREYRYLVLPNGLQTLLISDPNADKAAAALTVARGSFDEPADHDGLAHFLEHMLFLGTGKYPNVDEYTAFITTHGGSNNAYTATDHTNYFFDIEPSQLEPGLDRFVDFFVAPRFDAAYVDREKNAVNSEYQMQLRDDGWRGNAVSKVTMNPSYPGSRFNIGSLETLSGDVRGELIRFFETHYSADQMGLVVLGRQPLSELEALVAPRFGAIAKRPVMPPSRPGAAFAPGALPLELRYKTIRDARQLVFNFPVASPDKYYAEKPLDFIANLVGHEGTGSLHEWLKARGWIESLAAAGARMDDDNGLITVSIELTDEGARHVEDIGAALFKYFDLIRDSGLEKWRYDEQARIAELAFRYKEASSAIAYVSSLAPNFRLYPPRDLLVAPYLMTRFDPGVVTRYLNELRPDNVMIELAGPDVATDTVERWFKVPYHLEKLPGTRPATTLDLGALALPEPNPFVPEHTDLVGDVEELPKLAAGEPGLAVWIAPDTSFRVPRASLYLKLGVHGGLKTPRDVAAANLYARLVRDRLNAYAYPAEIAGLDYSVAADNSGFLITITGYNDKQRMLLDRILEAFVTAPMDPARIALYNAELARDWSNFKAERPYAQTFARLDQLLLSTSWSPERLAAELPTLDANALGEWRSMHLDKVVGTALLHGNATQADSTALVKLLNERLTLAADPIPDPQVTRLTPEQLVYSTDIAHDDAAIALYVQGQTEALHERALFGLAAQVIRSPYFSDLRTEQQLGYAVIATPAPIRRTPGLAFLVQSPVAGAPALVAATERFLDGFRATIAAMSDEEFAANQRGLVTRLLERDKSLFDRSQRYWADLDLGFTTFDSRDQIAKEVESITRAEFVQFYDHLVTLVQRDRLIVYSAGKFGGAPPGRELGRVDAFKGTFTSAPPPA